MRTSQTSSARVSSRMTGPRRIVTLVAFPTWFALGATAEAAEPASGAEDAAAEASPTETSTTTPTSTETSAATARRDPAGPVAEESFMEPPTPPPPGVAPIPATLPPAAQAPASYVEHLGPESYPGRMRGLYGGSLWLEPSFHGLQWPYMARTGIGISGSVWNDNGYEWIRRAEDVSPKPAPESPLLVPNSQMFFQQARAVLRVTPTYVNGNFFVQGQIEAVGNLCQVQSATNTVCAGAGTYSTDDLWVRFGQWNRWDVKVGRFEAWEVYHLGMGLDQYTLERIGAGMFGVDSGTKLEAPLFYGVNYLHDRPNDGMATGYAAFHGYFTDFLRVEVLGKMGTDNYRADRSTGDTASSYYGGRLAPILDIGWMKLKMGFEYAKRSPTTQTLEPGQPGRTKDAVEGRTQMGAGGSLQFVIAPIVEFGLNGAVGKQEETDGFAKTVDESSFTRRSAGGFANFRISDLTLLGIGTNWTSQTDQVLKDGNNNYTSQRQDFLAFQYLLGGQLFIKAVLAHAQAYFQPAESSSPTWKNNMYSVRLRMMYLF